MEIVTDKNSAQKAGELLSEYLKQTEDSVLLMCSGGSALSILEHIDSAAVPQGSVVTVLDERFTNDPSGSNFEQLLGTPLGKLESIDTRPEEGESLEAAAARFETALHGWRANHPSGKVVITQGIGSDGHTAGIFPLPEEGFEERFNNNERWVVGHHVPSQGYPDRITVTVPFLLKEVDYSLVFITGEGKRGIFEKIQSTNQSLYEFPAGIIHKMKDVTLITDLG